MSSASGLSLLNCAEVGDPAVADGLGDGAGERRVGQQQPAPRRDAVGLVVEALGKHLGQVLDRGRAQQLRVDRGHAVGAVRADDGQVGHADLPARAFLDQAHALRAALVSGKVGPDVVEQAAVDLVDDLQVPRQHHLKPRDRPFLQRFGQQRVVGVGQRSLRDVPGLVPVRASASSSRIRISSGTAIAGWVSLSWMATFSGNALQSALRAPEAAHEVGQRAGDQKILLHEAQALPHGRGIVGIEDPREGFGRERLGHARRRNRRG